MAAAADISGSRFLANCWRVYPLADDGALPHLTLYLAVAAATGPGV